MAHHLLAGDLFCLSLNVHTTLPLIANADHQLASHVSGLAKPVSFSNLLQGKYLFNNRTNLPASISSQIFSNSPPRGFTRVIAKRLPPSNPRATPNPIPGMPSQKT